MHRGGPSLSASLSASPSESTSLSMSESTSLSVSESTSLSASPSLSPVSGEPPRSTAPVQAIVVRASTEIMRRCRIRPPARYLEYGTVENRTLFTLVVFSCVVALKTVYDRAFPIVAIDVEVAVVSLAVAADLSVRRSGVIRDDFVLGGIGVRARIEARVRPVSVRHLQTDSAPTGR